ncbi:28189_t:CDS:1, partial [Dentiscutata erythropus]
MLNDFIRRTCGSSHLLLILLASHHQRTINDRLYQLHQLLQNHRVVSTPTETSECEDESQMNCF